MRNFSASLQSHLTSGTTRLCWCWKVTKKDGTILGFTNHDQALTFDSVTYEPESGFTPTEAQSTLGLSVDNTVIEGALSSARITEADIRTGLYDYASIEVYLVRWDSVGDRHLMKKGFIGEISRGKTFFQAEVRGLMDRFQEVQGKTYSYKCSARVGRPSTGCDVDLSGASYTVAATITETDGYNYLVVSGADSYEEEWFSRGRASFTSGSNSGTVRPIKSHLKELGVVRIDLWDPTPFEMSVSDTLDLIAGCDKTWATCKAKFGAGAANRFRGFPHIPGPRTVISYVNQGDPNLDGGGNFNGAD